MYMVIRYGNLMELGIGLACQWLIIAGCMRNADELYKITYGTEHQ
jgi:hypothetical protein